MDAAADPMTCVRRLLLFFHCLLLLLLLLLLPLLTHIPLLSSLSAFLHYSRSLTFLLS